MSKGSSRKENWMKLVCKDIVNNWGEMGCMKLKFEWSDLCSCGIEVGDFNTCKIWVCGNLLG